MKNHPDADGILYICGPLFQYMIVNMITGILMETVWSYGPGRQVPAGIAAADSYSILGVWSYLCLIIPAGAGCLCVRREAGRSLAWCRRHRIPAADLPTGALSVLFVAVICLSLGINFLVSLVSGHSGVSSGLAAALPGTAGFVLAALVYGIYMPFIEEILFRGILFSRMKEVLTRRRSDEAFGTQAARTDMRDEWTAVMISAALFGLYHGAVLQGIYAFVMGLVFAVAYGHTGRFSVPWGLHGACNLCILLLQRTDRYQAICTPAWTAAFFVLAAAGFYTVWRLQKNA